jgi:hypothetical protein
MKRPEAAGSPAADQPLDEMDAAILNDIREMFQEADPMPADLPERIQFSLTLRHLEFEVARLAAEEDQPTLAVRGVEQSRTITFESDSLTIMIRVDLGGTGTVRIDGWLAPPYPRTIELRTAAESLTTVADEGGRFVFTRVPHGSAQFVIRAEPGAADSGHGVVTPTLIL